MGYESLHAEMPLNFPDSEQTNFAIDSLLTAATGGHLSYEIDENLLNRQGNCEGVLVGGNLTLLISLLGSPTALSTDGKILFIEEVGEKLYHLDRMMQTLKRARKFENLSGLIVGALNDMTESDLKFGKTAEEIVFEAVSEYNFPVCFGFPAGHVPDNRALIFGRHTRLEVGKSVKIDFMEK
jgi:muramoyltetrapeptide carboxypeptidase